MDISLYEAEARGDQQLARSLAEAMKQIRAEFETVNSAGIHVHLLNEFTKKPKKQNASRISWDNPDPFLLITPDLPNIALRLLKGKIGAAKSPVAGISIISSVPIEAALQTQKALPMSDRASFYPSQFAPSQFNSNRYVQLELPGITAIGTKSHTSENH